jgi:hypothetical protein
VLVTQATNPGTGDNVEKVVRLSTLASSSAVTRFSKKPPEGCRAAAVVLETAPGVVPTLYFTDGLVLDELLGDGRGCLSVDAFEGQEAPIEPGSQEMFEILLNGRQRRVRPHRLGTYQMRSKAQLLGWSPA